MKHHLGIFLATATLAAGNVIAPRQLPLVDADALEADISVEALMTLGQELEDIAYSTPLRNRVIGSEGHELTLDWISGYLDDLSDSFTYYRQPFRTLFAHSEGTLTVFNNSIGIIFEYSPGGSVEGEFVPVDDLGCEASNYPDEVDGAIALISRGECEFGLKTALAASAGAIAAVVYNDVPGPIGSATLGPPPRPEGPYVPAFGIAKDKGERILEAIDHGESVTGTVEATADIRNITTENIIAETIGGDHSNVVMLGAHTDSVYDGPGINDDGSGTIALIETAIQLSKYSTTNAVRFAWWAAEEEGLLGSYHYVDTLNNSAAEFAKIRLFLDFDMLASPNYIYAIYDGDGSSFNLTGPPGSAAIEHFYQDWFESHGYNYTATAFDGRSDYAGFQENGIACGGLFTGAEELKTEMEAEMFGGEAGAALDPNYHQAGDNYTNLNFEPYEVMTKALAASVGYYATDLSSIPVPDRVRRNVRPRNYFGRLGRTSHRRIKKL